MNKPVNHQLELVAADFEEKPPADFDARYGGPASVDVLYAKYCAAHARWHATKSECDRTAVREAYDVWATAFLGEVNSRPVITSAARFWGAA
jgi:hypothetical protein